MGPRGRRCLRRAPARREDHHPGRPQRPPPRPARTTQGQTPVIEVQALPPTGTSQGETEGGSSGSSPAGGGGVTRSTSLGRLEASGRFRVISSQPEATAEPRNPPAPTSRPARFPPPTSPTALRPRTRIPRPTRKHAQRRTRAQSPKARTRRTATSPATRSPARAAASPTRAAARNGRRRKPDGGGRPATPEAAVQRPTSPPAASADKGGGKPTRAAAPKHSGKHDK